MAIVKVACPSCGNRYVVPEERLQRKAACKACGHEFAVSEAQLEEERETTSSGQPPWHVEINGARSGPFEREKVLALFGSSEITRNSLVWRQGMEDWQPLKSVSEFASEIPQIVPPSAEAPSGQETEGGAAMSAALVYPALSLSRYSGPVLNQALLLMAVVIGAALVYFPTCLGISALFSESSVLVDLRNLFQTAKRTLTGFVPAGRTLSIRHRAPRFLTFAKGCCSSVL